MSAAQAKGNTMIRTLITTVALALSLTNAFAQSNQQSQSTTATTTSEAQVSRVKTSDKHQKAVLDFIKG